LVGPTAKPRSTSYTQSLDIDLKDVSLDLLLGQAGELEFKDGQTSGSEDDLFALSLCSNLSSTEITGNTYLDQISNEQSNELLPIEQIFPLENSQGHFFGLTTPMDSSRRSSFPKASRNLLELPEDLTDELYVHVSYNHELKYC